MSNLIFLDEEDFKREVNILSNSITKNIIKNIPLQTPPKISSDNIIVKHLQEGRIYYSLATYTFQGKFTEADKQYLFDIGARWDKTLRGYKLHFEFLNDDIKKTIEQNFFGRRDFFGTLAQQQNTLSSYELTEQEHKILDNIIKILLLRIGKHYLIKSNQLNNITKIALEMKIVEQLRYTIDYRLKLALKYQMKNSIDLQVFYDNFFSSLNISIYDAVGFAIRQLLFLQQTQIAEKTFKTTSFQWIHRNPPQPQDRKVHINWWKSKRIFDLKAPPINPETHMPDLPGLLKHCHCKTKILY